MRETLQGISTQTLILNTKNSLNTMDSIVFCLENSIQMIVPSELTEARKTELSKYSSYILEDKGLIESGFSPTQQLPPGDFIFFTSGSSGQPKLIPKMMSDFQMELDDICSLWAQYFVGREILTTVSYQHIYGFIFTLLLPHHLQISYPKSLFYLEELVPQLKPGCTLISSPSHLKVIPQYCRDNNLTLSDVQVFSSGGPLSAQVAHDLEETLGLAPIEIYGSTETGGIAYRSQDSTQLQPWVPFPQVQFRILDKTLEILSPWCSSDWYLTDDLAQIQAEGFILQGRADRIRKVNEKRVSLDELEQRISEVPGVQDVKCQQPSDEVRNPKSNIWAWVELNPESKLCTLSKREAQNFIKKRLREFFELSLIPKRWVFKPIEYNAQSKLTMDVFMQSFQNEVLNPIVHQRDVQSESIKVDLSVPHELRYLAGHFPNFPIVPGVCQLQWVIQELESEHGLRFQGVRQLKFHGILRPGARILLELGKLNESTWKFVLSEGDQKYSSGKLSCRPL